jgi:hypothetical protein
VEGGREVQANDTPALVIPRGARLVAPEELRAEVEEAGVELEVEPGELVVTAAVLSDPDLDPWQAVVKREGGNMQLVAMISFQFPNSYLHSATYPSR